MLLIFFLVTSSMDTDKGLLRQLPPVADEQQVVDVRQDNVLTVTINAADSLMCNGEAVSPDELTRRVVKIATEKRLTHIVSVQVDRRTSYDAYFQMQNAIVAGYNLLRQRQARAQFGKAYADCSAEEKNAVGAYYPQRISEAMPSGEGGGL